MDCQWASASILRVFSEYSTGILWVLFEVKDNGNGIPPEQLHKIFDRFYRVDESRNFQISGVGLGLAIVKRLADLQHLKILVESQLNSGTTIQIIFPVI